MDKCYHCHQALWHSYYQDWMGHKVCATHNDTLTCSGCLRFLGPKSEYKEVEPGRVVCKYCLDNEITYENIHAILKWVHYHLCRVGFDDIQTDWIEFKIIDWKEMESLGFSTATGLHYGPGLLNQTIYVLSHMQKFIFASTLAHELLHAWQQDNNLDEFHHYGEEPHNTALCEGFAQMGSFLVYDIIEHPLARYMLEQMFYRTDPFYGIAFRKIHARYKQVGWSGIIREMRQHKLKI